MAGAFGFSGVGWVTNVRVWELSGAVVLLAGTAIRLHAIAALENQFTSRVTILNEHKLVRIGLYRYVRHPSYLGQILILVQPGTRLPDGPRRFQTCWEPRQGCDSKRRRVTRARGILAGVTDDGESAWACSVRRPLRGLATARWCRRCCSCPPHSWGRRAISSSPSCCRCPGSDPCT